jgi:hypothetical protein
MDKQARKEIETLAKRELKEMTTALRLEVAGNRLLPYLWKNIPFNLSHKEAYEETFKKPVPQKYESLIGDENTPILDQSEIQEVISDRATELLSDDPDSKYQLWQRIKRNDDSLPRGSELLQVLDTFTQNEKTIISQYDAHQAPIRDFKTIPRESCLKKLQECIDHNILMQPDINVHFKEHNVIELYKALKRKYLRGNDHDETTAISELNFIKMDPNENWATFEIRWSNCIIKYILMTQRTKIADSLEKI